MENNLHQEDNNYGQGTLYLCGTPIGNLEDIGLRTLRILKEVDLIAAEDTRHSRKLLSFYDIHKPLTSYHEHNEKSKGALLIEKLKTGKQIALITDAGMPGISDPGYEIVKMAAEAGIKVIPVPGPSAVVTAVSVSGLPSERFVFEGFLPVKKKERGQLIKELSRESRTVVLYESPHRLLKTLKELNEVMSQRSIAVTRELTKVYEEVWRGTVEEALEFYSHKKPLGEFCLVIGPALVEQVVEEDNQVQGEGPDKLLQSAMASGLTLRDAVQKVSQELCLSKKQVYQLALTMKDE